MNLTLTTLGFKNKLHLENLVASREEVVSWHLARGASSSLCEVHLSEAPQSYLLSAEQGGSAMVTSS